MPSAPSLHAAIALARSHSQLSAARSAARTRLPLPLDRDEYLQHQYISYLSALHFPRLHCDYYFQSAQLTFSRGFRLDLLPVPGNRGEILVPLSLRSQRHFSVVAAAGLA